jgi:hypothetical protein
MILENSYEIYCRFLFNKQRSIEGCEKDYSKFVDNSDLMYKCHSLYSTQWWGIISRISSIKNIYNMK